MRVLVAAGFRACSHFAHAINTIKMAEGFARLGNQVLLVCRRGEEGLVAPDELNEKYGIRADIQWYQARSLIPGRHVLRGWDFALLTAAKALRFRAELVYCRDYNIPSVSTRLGVATVAESHTQTDNVSRPFLRLVRTARHPHFRAWVTISDRLAAHYASLGVPSQKLLVLCDAVDLSLFLPPEKLPPSPYPAGRPLVVYVGHMYDYKGIPAILGAAQLAPEMEFHLVGGWPEDVEKQRHRVSEAGLTNVTFHGLKDHAEVPPYLWHADVLLLPPSAGHPSADWTSPVKMGEYMASGTPVVATSIPALRDWLTDEEVEFVRPDDPGDLAAGIRKVLGDPAYARSLAQRASAKAQEISYEKRAERVLAHIG